MTELATIPATADAERNIGVAELNKVSAGYSHVDVLHDVSLRLMAGRIFVLLGPNGAGKSTLVRLLTGTLPVRRGEFRLSDTTSRGTGRRPVGLAPQDIALYSWLTASENCIAFARLDGMKSGAARTRAIEVLRLSRCGEIAATRVSQLSGGYRRRVNIAVALMSDPALLILDEPTVGLDSEARQVVVEIMKAVALTGAAVMLVTHDFEVASAAADDVGILSDGRFVAQGPLVALLSETFGGRKVVELVLDAAPDPRQEKLLSERGAICGKAPGNWLVVGPSTYDAAALGVQFVPEGLRAIEIRVREPTLDDLYTLLTRRGATS